MYYCCCCSFILIFLLSDSVRCKLINNVDAFHRNQTISAGIILCVWWKLHHCLKEFPLFIDPCTGTYRFFQLATCSKPSIRDNHHKLFICHLLQIRQGLINTNISYNWKFCIALLWKFLCFFCVCKINKFSATRDRNRYNFKMATCTNLKFRA